MNPCLCGYLGNPRHACQCSPPLIERYLGRVSGPLLDRIDLHIEVPSVPFEELSSTADGTGSAATRQQVTRVRQVQAARFGPDSTVLNSRMSTRQLRRFCELDVAGKQLLRQALDELGLSARAHDRILRMARTIADLEGRPAIKSEHVVEAIGYRSLDRKLWMR